MARAAGVVIKEIESLLDELAESLEEPVPAAAVCDRMRELGSIRNRIEAAFTVTAGHLETSGAYRDDGSGGVLHWMCEHLHLARSAAAATVAAARDVRRMPATLSWFLAGRLTLSQLRLLRAARDANPTAFARDEQMLLDQSAALWLHHFARAVRYWMYINNEDEEDRKARERWEDRTLDLVDTFDNTVDIRGRLDAISGAVVKNELARIEQRLFEEDCKAAEARLGRRPHVTELDRNPRQRRADALVEMARRSYSLRDDTPHPRPLITVVIDHPTLQRICQLADGTHLTPGEAVPLFRDCDIERVVFGPGTRAEVSPTRRFYTGATRRAVEIRDLECTFPTCHQPYEHCEIDHIQPWAQGGPTTQANGRLACPHHNRSRPRSQLPDAGDPDHQPHDW